MNSKTRILAGVIPLIEIATARNLVGFYSMWEEPLFAFLIAVAFVALQIGTLMLFSLPLPPMTRRLLLIASCVLFVINGLSNVVMGYLRSEELFPASQLLPVLGFGGSATSLHVVAAYVSGLALLVAAAIFWLALGQYWRLEEDNVTAINTELEEILREGRGS